MLIAMMGKTYQDIAERKNEWMRQVNRSLITVSLITISPYYIMHFTRFIKIYFINSEKFQDRNIF